jgi:DNA-binding NtrC family response regulator
LERTLAQLSIGGSVLQTALPIKDGLLLSDKTLMTNAATQLLSGMHALLVEDQTLIALDTEMLLRELGAETVDSFTNAEAALAWLASASPDVAVLDINLGTSSSFPVAAEIHRRAKPFIFTTGYGDGIVIPDEYLGVQIVQKPYTRDTLASAFQTCLRPDKAPV